MHSAVAQLGDLPLNFSAIMNYMTMLPGPFYQGYRGRIWRTVVVALALLVVGGRRSCVILQRSTRLM